MVALQGSSIIATEWSMIVLTLLLVCVRLYVRVTHATQHRLLPYLSDAFVILAWLSFLLQGVLDILFYKHDFFNTNIDIFNPELGTGAEAALKVYFTKNLTYPNTMYSVKAAFLCLYHDFFPSHMKKMRFCLVAVDWFTALSFIAENAAVIFWCLPVARNWSLDPASYCSSNSSLAAWLIGTVPHLLTDVLIYALPLPVIFSLKLSKRQVWGLAGAFAIGFSCVLLAVLNITATYMQTSIEVAWMFTIFEQTNAVIVACCPALQVLFRFGSKNSIFSRSRVTGDSSNGTREVELASPNSSNGMTEQESIWGLEKQDSQTELRRDIEIGIEREFSVIELTKSNEGKFVKNSPSVITAHVYKH